MANGAPKGKAAAARDEKAQDVTGNFRGIKLKLPSKLPAVVALDVAEMQACTDDSKQLGILWRLLSGILGDDLSRIRQKIAEDNDAMDDLGALFEELLATITEPYSLTPGESVASGKP